MLKFVLKILPFSFMRKTINKQSKMNKKEEKQNIFTSLVRDDNNFSTVNFFLVAATIVGICLLIVPIIGIMVDVYYNHTITINLDGMAQYIISVAGIFGAAGLTNAWTEYSYRKYNKNIFEPTEHTRSPENSVYNSYYNNPKNNINNDPEYTDMYIDESQMEE